MIFIFSKLQLRCTIFIYVTLSQTSFFLFYVFSVIEGKMYQSQTNKNKPFWNKNENKKFKNSTQKTALLEKYTSTTPLLRRKTFICFTGGLSIFAVRITAVLGPLDKRFLTLMLETGNLKLVFASNAGEQHSLPLWASLSALVCFCSLHSYTSWYTFPNRCSIWEKVSTCRCTICLTKNVSTCTVLQVRFTG